MDFTINAQLILLPYIDEHNLGYCNNPFVVEGLWDLKKFLVV